MVCILQIRRELSNEPSIAKIGVISAENESPKVSRKLGVRRPVSGVIGSSPEVLPGCGAFLGAVWAGLSPDGRHEAPGRR